MNASVKWILAVIGTSLKWRIQTLQPLDRLAYDRCSIIDKTELDNCFTTDASN